MNKLSRYNPKKRGSFQISLSFYDWELSVTIGAIRKAIKIAEKRNQKGHTSYLRKLEKKYGDALGQVLKAEFRDLKLKEGQKEIAEVS